MSIFATSFKLGMGTLLSLGLGILTKAALTASPLVFESLESKAAGGAPVFNRVTWESQEHQDIWIMQQSHDGLKPSPHKWDRVAIVIDKTQSPKQAQFFQLEPGPLHGSAPAKKIPLKASCFTCHPNGLRALRPNFESKALTMSAFDKTRLLLWNLKIKSYGRVVGQGETLSASAKPFRWPQPHYNQVLKLKACTLCHKASGFGARGPLTRQNAHTIRFMVDKGFMPPFGLKLSQHDLQALDDFLKLPGDQKMARESSKK